MVRRRMGEDAQARRVCHMYKYMMYVHACPQFLRVMQNALACPRMKEHTRLKLTAVPRNNNTFSATVIFKIQIRNS
jgi:hypothetical protein